MKSLLAKFRVIFLIMGLVIFAYSEASGEERYLCVPDNSTGFKYNKNSKTWEQANFSTNDKYIVTQSDDKRCAFKVTRFGDTSRISCCEQGFNESGCLHCEGMITFYFNKKNGTYLLPHVLGYFSVLPGGFFETDEKSDTPYIQIGKCSPF